MSSGGGYGGGYGQPMGYQSMGYQPFGGYRQPMMGMPFGYQPFGGFQPQADAFGQAFGRPMQTQGPYDTAPPELPPRVVPPPELPPREVPGSDDMKGPPAATTPMFDPNLQYQQLYGSQPFAKGGGRTLNGY